MDNKNDKKILNVWSLLKGSSIHSPFFCFWFSVSPPFSRLTHSRTMNISFRMLSNSICLLFRVRKKNRFYVCYYMRWALNMLIPMHTGIWSNIYVCIIQHSTLFSIALTHAQIIYGISSHVWLLLDIWNLICTDENSHWNFIGCNSPRIFAVADDHK